MATAPEIPLDIKELLHDCMLALFWPKKKIAEFFQSVGYELPERYLNREGGTRHTIVVEAFSKLSARADRGYAVFQTMIDRLVNWTYFDPYWFETVQKLDRAEAEACIQRLRDAVSKRNATTDARRKTATASSVKQTRAGDLSALTTAFHKMFGTGMTVQARGKLFEKFLQELFNRQSINMGDPFNLTGEQIDGTFKFEGENYIVEAKWQDAATSTAQLYQFAHKVDGKMHGRGLFVSVNAFSHDGIKAIVHGKMIKTILVDGEDLSHVLEGRLTLVELLDYKIRAAQTRGDVYVCAVRNAPKI
ncbi:MAG: restriction endonuclease [Sphingomonas sp.]|nr:restriction endonuclease [Sphingomonas sp.]